MELTNKAMYIKGLADGLGLDAASKEGKVIAALLELVNEMAGTIEEMQSKMRDLEDYVEELDEDLGDVEDLMFDDWDDDVDFDDDDVLLSDLIEQGQQICMDVARITDEDEFEDLQGTKIAVQYAAAYLYEHREEADHHQLVMDLRSMLFGVRKP